MKKYSVIFILIITAIVLMIYIMMKPVPYKVHFSVFILSLFLVILLIVRIDNMYKYITKKVD